MARLDPDKTQEVSQAAPSPAKVSIAEQSSLSAAAASDIDHVSLLTEVPLTALEVKLETMSGTRYVKLRLTETNLIIGVKIELDTYAFYRDPPLPVQVVIGYDRRTNREFLYIELNPSQHLGKDAHAYTSPDWADNCIYNSLADPSLGQPLLIYYLKIFEKYKIFIPFYTYEILQDPHYCGQGNKSGYLCLASDVSRPGQEKFKDRMDDYYEEFHKLVLGLDCNDPLLESQEEGDDECESSSDFEANANFPITENSEKNKNRLMFGEADFSFSTAFLKKHEENITRAGKIIVTEYQSKEDLKKVHGNFKCKLHLMAALSERDSKDESHSSCYIYIKSSKELFFIDKNGRQELVPISDVNLFERVLNKIMKDLPSKELNQSQLESLITANGGHTCNPFLLNIKYLESKGVEVRFGIDATKSSEIFRDQRFRYIHFNCPHDRSDFRRSRTLPIMIREFFLNASKIQYIGDCIYMALPTPVDQGTKEHREAYIYQVYDAAAGAGYKLVKKRKFDAERYPGYEHRITGRRATNKVSENLREYIFKKIEPPVDLPEAIHYKSPTVEKEFDVGEPSYGKGHILPDISTDSDSSNFSDSDSLSDFLKGGNQEYLDDINSVGNGNIPITQEMFAALYASGKKNFSKCIFENNIDFRGFNLKNFNFSGAVLKDAVFDEEIDLTDANFSDAILEDADFTGCDLRRTILSRIVAPRICFSGANLTGVNFGGANLQQATFDSLVTQPTYLEDVVFSGADLEGARFCSNGIEEDYYVRFNSNTLFEGACLKNVEFTGCCLSGINFNGVNLVQARFKNCWLYGYDGYVPTSFNNATVTGASFEDVEWQPPEFEENIANRDHSQDATFENVKGEIARWTGRQPKPSRLILPNPIIAVSPSQAAHSTFFPTKETYKKLTGLDEVVSSNFGIIKER